VCKPDSHPTLYERLAFWQANDGMATCERRHWNGRFTELTMYRSINDVLLLDGKDALSVNWFEITVVNTKTGEQLYHSAVMLSLNLLALLFHTVLEWSDDKYALLRRVLARRQTFCDDIRALTRSLVFDRWGHVIDFMLRGLELPSQPDTS
jgi:hypothetical protein